MFILTLSNSTIYLMERLVQSVPKELLNYFKSKPELLFKRSKDFIENTKFKSRLSVMTWNILATGYTSPSAYPYVNPKYLHDDHRFQMISYDLLFNNCDIVCLQEVEKRNYEKYFVENLKEYDGIFEKRPGLTCDGLALFYKKELFKPVYYSVVNLNTIKSIDHSVVKRCLKTNNLAQILILEPKMNKSLFDYLAVINLHLHWDPNRDVMKYLQMSEILNSTYKYTQEFKPSNKKIKMPIVLCGDFNSLPGSNVVDLICNRFTPDKIKQDDHEDYKSIFNNTNRLGLIDTHSHSSNFYVTNIKNNFTGKLDYIFYNPDEAFISFDASYIDTKKFTEETALPNSFHGSDHLYLITKFYV